MQRDLLGTLRLLASEESPRELQQFLGDSSGELSDLLTTPSETLLAVCQLDQPERYQKVLKLVRSAKARVRQRRQEQNANLALAAAEMLRQLADWHDDKVQLDPKIVLGTLLADTTKVAVAFDVKGFGRFTVATKRLRAAKKTLRQREIECFVDQEGLHFRWRAGRGGLTLPEYELSRAERERCLHVALAPRLTKALRKTPSWAARAVGDVAFL